MNKYAWRAIKARQAAQNDDSPRRMESNRPGRCAHCNGFFAAGTEIFYSYSSKSCWHLDCFIPWKAARDAARNAAQREHYHDQAHDQAHASPEPEPDRPLYREIEFKAGFLRYSAYCNQLVTDENGFALFFSLFGSDSAIKGIGAEFVDKTPRDSISYEQPHPRRSWTETKYIKKTNRAKYKRRALKIGNGAQEIIFVENFLPDCGTLDATWKFLLLQPQDDAADTVYRYLYKHGNTPMMHHWKDALYEALTLNFDRYKYGKRPEDSARCKLFEPQIGNVRVIGIRAEETSLDNLVSRLVRAGNVRFDA